MFGLGKVAVNRAVDTAYDWTRDAWNRLATTRQPKMGIGSVGNTALCHFERCHQTTTPPKVVADIKAGRERQKLLGVSDYDQLDKYDLHFDDASQAAVLLAAGFKEVELARKGFPVFFYDRDHVKVPRVCKYVRPALFIESVDGVKSDRTRVRNYGYTDGSVLDSYGLRSFDVIQMAVLLAAGYKERDLERQGFSSAMLKPMVIHTKIAKISYSISMVKAERERQTLLGVSDYDQLDKYDLNFEISSNFMQMLVKEAWILLAAGYTPAALVAQGFYDGMLLWCEAFAERPTTFYECGYGGVDVQNLFSDDQSFRRALENVHSRYQTIRSIKPHKRALREAAGAKAV
jgi:hypothetical protein